MRLIDITGFCESLSDHETVSGLLTKLSKQPTIDAVPVVRCQECANHSEVDGYHYCKFWRMYCPDDSEFFCKAGQRKIETILPKSDAKNESLEAKQ